MVRINKIGLVLILLLVIIGSAIAAPPFSVTDENFLDNELQIHRPEMRYYVQDNNLTLFFRAHNSTGYVLDNTTTDCSISIINQRGELFEYAPLLFNETTEVFYYFFDYSATPCCINYEYAIYCNNSLEAGFTSAGFQINPIGGEVEQNNSTFMMIFIFFGLATLLSIFMIGYSKNKYLKLMYTNLTALSLMITLMFVQWFVTLTYPLATTLIKSITNFYDWSITGLWVTILITLILLVVFNILDNFRRKVTKEAGVWNQYDK